MTTASQYASNRDIKRVVTQAAQHIIVGAVRFTVDGDIIVLTPEMARAESAKDKYFEDSGS